MLVGVLLGALFLCLTLDALIWHPAEYPFVLAIMAVLLGLFALLVMIPQSISMMITPRTFMVADSDGITLHHYGGSTKIDRDENGKMYIERKKGRMITIPWIHVLSFSRDRSTLGRSSSHGTTSAKSKCLHIAIAPSVNLDGFTTKGLIATDSAIDTNALSSGEYAQLTVGELDDNKCTHCWILARFLPGGIEHAIQVLEGMKDRYATG